jgi:uncharacterized peroxidase-related enzyme
LRAQGASDELVDAIGTGNLESAKIEPRDRALLTFVKKLTLSPAEMTDADVQAMRDAGFTDEQIWEATFEVGFFSMLNRMADAYGLDYPSGGWLPPGDRRPAPGPPLRTPGPPLRTPGPPLRTAP